MKTFSFSTHNLNLDLLNIPAISNSMHENCLGLSCRIIFNENYLRIER